MLKKDFIEFMEVRPALSVHGIGLHISSAWANYLAAELRRLRDNDEFRVKMAADLLPIMKLYGFNDKVLKDRYK